MRSEKEIRSARCGRTRTRSALRRWRAVREARAQKQRSSPPVRRRARHAAHARARSGANGGASPKLGKRTVRVATQLLAARDAAPRALTLAEVYADPDDGASLRTIVERLLALRGVDADVAVAAGERIARTRDESLPQAKARAADAAADLEGACEDHRALALRIRVLRLQLAKLRRSKKQKAASRRAAERAELREMVERRMLGLPPKPRRSPRRMRRQERAATRIANALRRVAAQRGYSRMRVAARALQAAVRAAASRRTPLALPPQSPSRTSAKRSS